ncbi:MAG: glycosyltransferase family 2 protein [Pseudomonadota bacterium]
MQSPVRLSLIVPVLDEEETVGPFLEASGAALTDAIALLPDGSDWEWVFVNDGSVDATEVVLTTRAAADPRIRLVNLSRNFGKEAAMAAGLDMATGDAVIPIDVDLQDPPATIVPMVREWSAGAQVVNARRVDRSTDSLPKRLSATWFYRLYNKVADQPIPENVGDFRLLGREALDVIRRLPESSRFNKGLFNWVGFNVATVDYVREARVAGQSKWRPWQLWNFALDGITASTTVPLRLWTYVGAVFAMLSFAYAAFLIVRTLILGVDVPGYASLLVMVLFLGGLQMLSLGIMGEYIGRIAKEVRGRPLYVVASTVGFDDQPQLSETVS